MHTFHDLEFSFGFYVQVNAKSSIMIPTCKQCGLKPGSECPIVLNVTS